MRNIFLKILRKDYNLVTVDIDKKKIPYFNLDIRNDFKFNLFLKDKFFDVILICEVLEHILYEEVEGILKKLKKKLKKNGKFIISVPNRQKYLQLHLSQYGFSNRKRNLLVFIIKKIFWCLNTFMDMFSKIQYKFINKKIKFISSNEGHKWELGIDIYSVEDFRKLLQKYFIIISEERILGNPYHHFFILKK